MHMQHHTCIHTYPIRDLESTLMQTTVNIEKIVESTHSIYYRLCVHTSYTQPPIESSVTSCSHISEWSLMGFNAKHAIIAEELYSVRPDTYSKCSRERQEAIDRGIGRSTDMLSRWMTRKNLAHSSQTTMDEDDGITVTIASSACLRPKPQGI